MWQSVRRSRFGLLAAISLATVVVLVAMWGLSIGHWWPILVTTPNHELDILSDDGVLGIVLDFHGPRNSAERRYSFQSYRSPLDRDRADYWVQTFNRWGFGAYFFRGPANHRVLMIFYTPFWLPTIVLAIPPVLYLFHRTRRHRRQSE